LAPKCGIKRVKKESDKKMMMATQNKNKKKVVKEDLVLPLLTKNKDKFSISSLHFITLLFWPSQITQNSFLFLLIYVMIYIYATSQLKPCNWDASKNLLKTKIIDL